ncbi:MaoC family dehydratase [Herbaspirillum sp. RTI4]|uniref:MaoC family dehydratase n=1 Tax=Herbaspirillum sp. RTI4 TaxID=3048640 RepID=UPI002AB52912|nr:MaoC family dehydratase [Herbaspirillum sp. RTI4]MDY7578555.1 MaoC family dehydratase [Herbaspirillum sp. RTI4]MEA9981139.1 MaoC family dehydratase [Herbaspirillum sp. RTI4]
MREISTLAELKELVGQEIALTEWMVIDQQRVNLFAEATGDRQWIHVDVERSRRELPSGGTIAHGFLTLALIPMWLEQAISMSAVEMALNYGLDRVRFPAPLPVGDKVRARIVLLAMQDIAGGVQLTWEITVEREGGEKPVCVAQFLMRAYP